MRKRLLVGFAALGMVAMIFVPPILMVVTTMGGTSEDVAGCGGGSVVLAGATSEDLDEVQRANAGAVVSTGRQLKVPDRGIVIALAVAHQESGFRNYANDGKGDDLHSSQRGIEASLRLPHDAVGSDHGSLGIFQQQWPWWGSMEELMTPSVAAQKFYARLVLVPGWEDMAVTEAGQAVQKSAYPDAYADDEALAASLLAEASGSVDTVALSDGSCASSTVFNGSVVYPIPATAAVVDQKNFGEQGPSWTKFHSGTDLSTSCGTPVLAATGGTVVVLTDQPWSGAWLVQVSTGPGQLTTWYAHMQAVDVVSGQQVQAGQQIGQVGNEGNSHGCHLHFEVHPEGGSIYEDPIDPTPWLAANVGGVQTIATSSLTGQPVTLMTANIPWSLTPQQAQAQLEYVLSANPDVLVLQEIGQRDVPAMVAATGGTWEAWQPSPLGQRTTAIVWNPTKFTPAQRGLALGFKGGPYDRWMEWMLFQSADGVVLPVVGMHMPSGSLKSAEMEGFYKVMTASYRALLAGLAKAGYPPLVGADWNSPLDHAREPWSPVPTLNSIGFATNWQSGRPCEGSSKHGGNIDGWAYMPAAHQLVDHGCLEYGLSDHRPVWITVRLLMAEE